MQLCNLSIKERLTAMDGGDADIALLHGCNLLGNAGAFVEEKIPAHPSLDIKKAGKNRPF